MTRDAIPQFVGARVRRREDPALVTGRGNFVADIPLENAATMAFVRSPYAHANVRSIDARGALSLPGVITVFTAEDLNPRFMKPFSFAKSSDNGNLEKLFEQKRFPLAAGRVRHVGEPVAVVIAENPYVAADAVDAVVVDYDPLPVVTDPEVALSEGAQLVHETCPRNRGFEWRLDGGDIDAAMSQADKVVELRVVIQRIIPNAMEPRAAAATYDGADGFTLWASTQIPHGLRDAVAGMLGIEEKQLRVIAPEVGGGFGAKANVYAEDVLAVLLARHLRRSIRWVASKSEDYLTTSHGRDQIAVLRLGATADGRIVGADLSVTMDCGAYFSGATPIIPAFTGIMIPGVYDFQNVRARAVGAFTNKVWSEPYRGAGRPEAAYLIERGIDKLADVLAIDPIEIRRRNFIAPEKFPYKTATGLTYDSGEYARALDKLLEHVDYEKLREDQAKRREAGGKLLGIGVATYVEICGFGPWEHSTVRVAADGKVTVLTGTSPHGQGHATSWAQIAADTLQVPIESVEVLHGDTGIVPKGIGTFGSRSAPVGGAAVFQSAEEVREGAKAIAAHLLEVAAADVRLEEGSFHVVGMRSRSVSWQDVAAAGHSEELPEQLRGKLNKALEFVPAGDTYPFGAHACVLEIDPDTGEIEPTPGSRAGARWYRSRDRASLVGGRGVRRVR